VRIRFGEACLDIDARQLSVNDAPVHLSAKAYELLKLLLERRPAAVSKSDLQDRLWPDTFVSEANLPTLVAEIRDALGDNARRPRFIRTVHGFGYAFSAQADEERSTSNAITGCWLASDAGRTPLVEGRNILGRGEDADVVLASATVSRHHACIDVDDNRATIADLNSKNGTYVDGQLLSAARRLEDGDRIRVGSFLLTFHQHASAVSTSTQVKPDARPLRASPSS
jgi:DNA-binding winged helix-turn-helix (wHTH) protein